MKSTALLVVRGAEMSTDTTDMSDFQTPACFLFTRLLSNTKRTSLAKTVALEHATSSPSHPKFLEITK